uniref:hypothetical protein n=1 Tax=Komagataeibacter xylinus TaxID=28448 RepID=UPI0006628F69|nr:hypothetical protein [Komagataeibacter xylinus]
MLVRPDSGAVDYPIFIGGISSLTSENPLDHAIFAPMAGNACVPIDDLPVSLPGSNAGYQSMIAHEAGPYGELYLPCCRHDGAIGGRRLERRHAGLTLTCVGGGP